MRERVHPDCAKPASAAVVPSAPITHRWSSYQEAIYGEAHGPDNLIIEGVAGCAKTTTLEEFLRRSGVEAQYLVFNRRNADEAADRMPDHVLASTFHSAAWSHLKRFLGGTARIDGRKTHRLFSAMIERGVVSDREAELNGDAIRKLVGLAKNAGVGVGSICDDIPSEWERIADHHGIDFEGDPDDPFSDADKARARAIDLARRLLHESFEHRETVDFDDMLWLTMRLGVPLPAYPLVCVDEAQDTNAIQRALLHRFVGLQGRLVAVGDRRQAIYGFRGADADAMDRIKAEFSCRQMALSVNYRCSKAVIDLAKTLCPQIEAHDGAPDGAVTSGPIAMTAFQQTDAILCRVTAPLMTLAYRLIRNRIRCVVLGREIGEQLVSFIKKAGGRGVMQMDLDTLSDRMERMTSRDASAAIARGQDERAQSLHDRYDCIVAAIESLDEDHQTVADLIDAIQSLFDDDGTGRLTLSTIHKAKGLEWHTVHVLDPSRMPSKWAKKPWQVEQETNLMYVAYTRAKYTLHFIESIDITEA